MERSVYNESQKMMQKAGREQYHKVALIIKYLSRILTSTLRVRLQKTEAICLVLMDG